MMARSVRLTPAQRASLRDTICEIAVDGTVTVGGVPGVPLADVAMRSADYRPLWDAWTPDITDPETYRDPDVIIGGGQHGAIANDPGYLKKGESWTKGGKNSPHLRVRKTKRKFGVTSTRPFFGRLDDHWVDRVIKAMEIYVATGKVTHG